MSSSLSSYDVLYYTYSRGDRQPRIWYINITNFIEQSTRAGRRSECVLYYYTFVIKFVWAIARETRLRLRCSNNTAVRRVRGFYRIAYGGNCVGLWNQIFRDPVLPFTLRRRTGRSIFIPQYRREQRLWGSHHNYIA